MTLCEGVGGGPRVVRPGLAGEAWRGARQNSNEAGRGAPGEAWCARQNSGSGLSFSIAKQAAFDTGTAPALLQCTGGQPAAGSKAGTRLPG